MNKKVFFVLAFIAAFALILPRADAIAWKYNLQDALKAAKSQGKPVMIDFYTDWCGWCKKLDSDTYSDPKVNAASAKFICVKINADKEKDLTNKYGVSGFPTIIFLDSNGKVLQKIPGFLPPAGFLQNMNKILSTTPKPMAKIDEKPPVEAGGFAVIDDRAGKRDKGGKLLPPKTVGQEFVYNGYIESGKGGIIGQINYKGGTYFVKKGDIFARFQVISIDKGSVVLASDNGEITLESKKPYGKTGFISDISNAITQPVETRSMIDRVEIEESFPALASGKARAMILSLTFAIILIFYIYYALCLQFIAAKTKTLNGWMAWVPVLNIFLVLNIAWIKYRFLVIPVITFFAFILISAFVAMFNPLVGLAFTAAIVLNSLYFVILMAYVWYKVAIARGKSPGLAAVLTILMFISPLNLIALGYLAFSK
ncbi:MAG: thioredoxin family protein [Candidatus Omnitrophica bacterium]|nr:thioredoxin family protein [Candidatus Omnitrophota bacterium]